jgi:hypothetical protein
MNSITFSHLNYLAVIVCTLAYFIIGALWFSPVLFSKSWMAGHGISMPNSDADKARMRKEMPKMMAITFLLCLIGTVAIAYLEAAFGINNWMTGCKLGLFAGIFVFITLALSYMYTKKSFKLVLIDAGYHIVSLIIVATILAIWK